VRWVQALALSPLAAAPDDGESALGSSATSHGPAPAASSKGQRADTVSGSGSNGQGSLASTDPACRRQHLETLGRLTRMWLAAGNAAEALRWAAAALAANDGDADALEAVGDCLRCEAAVWRPCTRWPARHPLSAPGEEPS
jgi:hypothetical protein